MLSPKKIPRHARVAGSKRSNRPRTVAAGRAMASNLKNPNSTRFVQTKITMDEEYSTSSKRKRQAATTCEKLQTRGHNRWAIPKKDFLYDGRCGSRLIQPRVKSRSPWLHMQRARFKGNPYHPNCEPSLFHKRTHGVSRQQAQRQAC